MGIYLNIAILTTIALAIIMLIIVLIIRFSKEESLLEDIPFIINFCSKNSFPEKGVAYGMLKNIEAGKNERRVVSIEQRDVLPKNFENIKEIKVVVDKNKIVTIPKGGDWSRQKNIMLLLPASASDFPDSLKSTPFGVSLMLMTEIQNAVNDELSSVKEGSTRKSEILKRLGDGELSREHIAAIDEIFKDVVRLSTEAKKEVKSSYSSVNMSPPGSNPGGF